MALKQERRRIKELERELHRKDKALAETAALLVLSKKLAGDLPRRRGRMTRLEDRQTLIHLIAEARANGCPAGTRLCFGGDRSAHHPTLAEERWSDTR